MLKVLSLFDGIGGARCALDYLGVECQYYASEVDKYSIKVSSSNYPDIIHLGDVNNWRNWDLPEIALLVGGSPCQGFSYAGKGLNFDDPRSKLFFTYVEILKELKPKYFLLENVKMRKEWQDVISKELGVQPILINSALVTAQNRERLYWTNIPNIKQPKDREIYLRDIVLFDDLPVVVHNIYGGFKEETVRVFENKSPTLRTPAGGGHIPSFVKNDLLVKCARVVGRRLGEDGKRDDYNTDIEHIQYVETRYDDKSGALTTVEKDNMLVDLAELKRRLELSPEALDYMNRTVKGGRNHWDFNHHSDIGKDKSSAIVANFFKGVPYNVLKDWDCIRAFHPVECERLQGFPDNYTAVISNTQRYKGLGNSFTVPVIAHILSYIPEIESELWQLNLEQENISVSYVTTSGLIQ